MSLFNEQRLAGTVKAHNRDAQMELRIEGDVAGDMRWTWRFTP